MKGTYRIEMIFDVDGSAFEKNQNDEMVKVWFRTLEKIERMLDVQDFKNASGTIIDSDLKTIGSFTIYGHEGYK